MLAYRIAASCLTLILLLVAFTVKASVVQVNADSDQVDLGITTDYLIDRQAQFSIAELVNNSVPVEWTSANNRSPSFGFNRAPIWYRFTLLNTDQQAIQKLLCLSSRAPWSVDIFAQVEGAPVAPIAQNVGMKSPYSNRTIDHYFILNRIDLPPGKPVTVYYRFQSFADSSFYLGLHEESAFLARDRRLMLLQGAVYGLVTCMTLITLLIFLLSRDVNFFYYFLLSSSVIVSQLIQNSLIHMLFPEAGRSVPIFWYANAMVFGFLLTLFTFNFNKTRYTMPRLTKATYVLAVVIGLLQLLIYARGYEQITPLVSAGFSLLLVILLGTSFRSYQQGYKPAIYSLLGIVALFVTISSEIVQGLGLFHTQQGQTVLVMIGLVIMTSVFAIGLGSYYNYMRGETTRLRMEEEVKKIRAQKAELDAERTNEFLANMSHEIRTPINGILGMSEILSHTKLDEAQSYYNRMVITSGKTLLCVINDILDFSKLRSNKVTVENISFSMDDVFANSMTAHSSLAGNKGVQLVGYYQPDIPVFFFGDPYRIQQIINNLLSNAIKFTVEGQVDFVVGGERLGEGLFNLHCRIRDTGVGIPEDKMQFLFDAFEQADTSITRKFGGTGLGLTIAKQLAELMGGTIEVQSKLEGGSEFTVSLPLQLDADRETLRREQLTALQGNTLLLIESDQLYCDRLNSIFTYWGMHVTVADRISHGIKLMQDQAWHPDLVMVDAQSQQDTEIAALSALLEQSVPVVCARLKPGQLPSELSASMNLIVMPESVSITELSACLLKALDSEGAVADYLQASARQQNLPQFPGVHLLIAEDNDVNRSVIRVMASKLGISTTIVDNGEQALEYWQQKPQGFAGILMDCEMPVMDGYASASSIRKVEQELGLPRIPIVALTAHVLPEYRTRCLESGMDDLVVKPVSLDDLTRAVEEHFA